MVVAAALIAAAVVGLTDRPAELTGPDASAYSAWLAHRAVEVEGLAGGTACADAETRFVSVSELPQSLVETSQTLKTTSQGPVVVEHLRVVGCGRDTRQNILVFRLTAGSWRGLALMAGETRTDPRLQVDTARQAMTVAMLNPPRLTCSPEEMKKSMRWGETKIVQPPDAQGLWKEHWPLSLCGADRPLDITFTPTPSDGGTNFNVVPGWK